MEQNEHRHNPNIAINAKDFGIPTFENPTNQNLAEIREAINERLITLSMLSAYLSNEVIGPGLKFHNDYKSKKIEKWIKKAKVWITEMTDAITDGKIDSFIIDPNTYSPNILLFLELEERLNKLKKEFQLL